MLVEEIWNDWDSVYADKSSTYNVVANNPDERVKLWGLQLYLNRKSILIDKIGLNNSLKEIQNVFNAKSTENIGTALQSWSMFILALSKENMLTAKKIDLAQIPFVAGIKKSITHIIASWVRLCCVIPNLEEHWEKVVVVFLKNVLNYSPKHVGFCLTAIIRGNTFNESLEETIMQVFNPLTEHSSVLGRFPTLNPDFLESKFSDLSKIFFNSLSSIPDIQPENINSLVTPRDISRSYLDAYNALTLFLSSRTCKLIHPSQNTVDQVHNFFLNIKAPNDVNDLIMKTSFLKVFLVSMDATILASQKFRIARNTSNISIFNDTKLNNIAITPVVAIFAILLEKSDFMFSRFSTEVKSLFDNCISCAKSNLFALDNYKALCSVLDVSLINDNSANHALNGLTIWNIISIRVTNYLDSKSLSDSFSSHDNILEIVKFPINHVALASENVPNNQPPYLKSLVEGWTRLISSLKANTMIPSKWDGQVCSIMQHLINKPSWFSCHCFAHLINIYLMGTLLIEDDTVNPFIMTKPSVELRKLTFDYLRAFTLYLVAENKVFQKSLKNDALTDLLGLAGTLSTTLKLNNEERTIILKFVVSCVCIIPDDAVLLNILRHYNKSDELVDYLKERNDLYQTTYDLLQMADFNKNHCNLFNLGSKRKTDDIPSSRLKKKRINGDDSSYSPNHVDLFISDSPIIVKKPKRVSFEPSLCNSSTQKSINERLMENLSQFNNPETQEQPLDKAFFKLI